MRAIRFHHYGSSEVLQREDIPIPKPKADEVLIKVAATSFNPVDAMLRAGRLRERVPLQLPHAPGLDVTGGGRE
jgi:NADPH:quinone reductase-like Zn-dependent oxidoreductase